MWSIIMNIAGILMFISFVIAIIVTKILYNLDWKIKASSLIFMSLMIGINLLLLNIHPQTDIVAIQGTGYVGYSYSAIIMFIVDSIICGILLTLFAPELQKLNHKIDQTNRKLGKKHSDH